MMRSRHLLLLGVLFFSQPAVAQEADSVATLEMNVDSLNISLEGVPEYIRSAPRPRQKLEFPRTWEFTDRRVIEWLINETSVFAPENPESLKWIDITGDGAGINDIMIIEPDNVPKVTESYMFSDAIQAFISLWEQEENNVISGGPDELNPVYYDPEHEQYSHFQPESPLAAMLSDIFIAVERSYSLDGSLQLYLNQDENGFNFEIYGYDPSLLAFEQKPPGVPDSVMVRDIFFNNRTVADTTYQSILFDVVYLDRAVQDTLYIPDGLDEETRRRILENQE